MTATAWSQGLLISGDESRHFSPIPRPIPIPRPPVQPNQPELLYRVSELDVQATLKDGIASVLLSQTFENNGSQVSQVRFLFPLPYDSAISDMTFMVDGKELSGKVLEADEAKKIYQNYVRRSQDPALVQWMGTGLIQTEVFPVPPGAKRTVSLRFTHVVRRLDGQLDWQLPLTAAACSTAPVDKLNIKVRIQSSHDIGNVFSPSDDVDVNRISDREAVVSYQKKNFVPKRSFRLLIDDRDQDVAATLVTYRQNSQDDGYFLVMLHPEFKAAASKEEIGKNIILVLDKSGSMRGEKMQQARDALLYVVKNLGENDEFGIVAYDSQVISFREELLPANQKNRDAAEAFVASLDAAGGTNIGQALETGLKMIDSDQRSSYVIFLTDGQPTVGERDPRQIVAKTVSHNDHRARLLSFGVGFDVNSQLLDRISRECFGQTFFVEPAEDIEEKVSSLYTRIGAPALTNPKWQLIGDDGKPFKGLKKVYPSQLYDLFSGDQIVISGRYEKGGKATLVLTGKIGKEERTFEYPVKLKKGDTGSETAYVASLWANRRVAAIIDEIDLEGKRPELVDELIALSKKYGILTPFTSFLAEEPALRFDSDLARARTSSDLNSLAQQSGQSGFQLRQYKDSLARGSNAATFESQSNAQTASPLPPAGMGGMGGAVVVQGRGIGRPADAARPNFTTPGSIGATTVEKQITQPAARQFGDRGFFHENDTWVDSSATQQQIKDAQKVERFSDQYFEIAAKYQDLLGPLLATQEKVVVVLDKVTYRFE